MTTEQQQGIRPSYRPTAARAQHKALQAWERGGRKGKRPETPDYDAIQADYAEKVNGGGKRKRTSTGNGRARRSERGQQAIAAQEAARDTRVETHRLTEDELVAHVRKVRTDHPESSVTDELLYARWVENLSVSRERFVAAWAEAEKPAPKVAPRKSASKPAPAKVPAAKAPAKPAAPRASKAA